jgi:hypothetical protein
MTEINTHYLVVNGKLESQPLTMGQDLNVIVTVYSIEDRDLQNGTVDRIYKAKISDISDEGK